MMILANVLIESSATAFLLGLLVISGLTLALGWLMSLVVDDTSQRELPSMQEDPEPYAIAYLRGGVTEVIQVIAFDLVQRDYARLVSEESVFSTDQWIVQAAEPPQTSFLSPLEKMVFDQLQQRVRLKDLLHLKQLQDAVEVRCEPFKAAYIKQGMLHGPQVAQRFALLRGLGLGAVVCVGGYRLLVTQEPILLGGILLSALLMVLVSGARHYRVTDLGQRYLHQLEHTYDDLRARQERHEQLIDSHGLLLSAIYGPRAITQHSPQEELRL